MGLTGNAASALSEQATEKAPVKLQTAAHDALSRYVITKLGNQD